jgi:hypothetical protein
MSRYALTPLQTDIHRSPVQGEYHRTTGEWILAQSPSSFSETPLSGSGILQPNHPVPPKYAVPSDSGISAADSRSPNDGMSETSEDLEMHRLQQEIDGVRKEAGTYRALLFHQQQAWSEEKSSYEENIHKLETVIYSMRVENIAQPMEWSSQAQGSLPDDPTKQDSVDQDNPTAPIVKFEEDLDGIGSQVSQGPVRLYDEPTEINDEQPQALDQHPLDEPMHDFNVNDNTSESESEIELADEEKFMGEIFRYHKKRAFEELMHTTALDSSGPQAGPSRPIGNSGGDQGANGSSSNGRPEKSKRGREGENGGADSNGRDDKDEDDNAAPEPKRSKPNSGRRLACIFYQRAPHEHQRNACTGPGWPAIKGLR